MPLPLIPLAVGAAAILAVAKRRQAAEAGHFLPPGPSAADLWEEANKAYQASEQASVASEISTLAEAAKVQGTTAGVLNAPGGGAPEPVAGQGGTTGPTVQATIEALNQAAAGGLPTLSDVRQATSEAAASGGATAPILYEDAMGSAVTGTISTAAGI